MYEPCFLGINMESLKNLWVEHVESYYYDKAEDVCLCHQDRIPVALLSHRQVQGHTYCH